MNNPFTEIETRLSNIETLILDLKHQYPLNEPQSEKPQNIKEVSVLTGKTPPTIYGYVQRNEIPYHKKGNRLYFFKSEIIDWIKTGKQKTIKELEAETDELLSNKNKGLK